MFGFRKHRVITDKPIEDKIKDYIHSLAQMREELNTALGTLEANGNKPVTVHRHVMNTRFDIENLVYDLKQYTRKI